MDALHDVQESYSAFRPAPDRGGNVYLCQCGFQHCESLHNFGPAVRDHYLIHCVLSGKGTFTVGDRKFRLSAGQGFLIHPGIITTYTADKTEPWYYCWVGFGGSGSDFIINQCGLSLEQPIFSFKNPEKMEKCVGEIYRSINPSENPFLTTARLYDFFALLYRERYPRGILKPGHCGKRHGIRRPELLLRRHRGGSGPPRRREPEPSLPHFQKDAGDVPSGIPLGLQADKGTGADGDLRPKHH